MGKSNILCFPVVLGIKLKASDTVGRYSATELHSRTLYGFLVGLCVCCMHTHVHMCVHAVEARADVGCIPLLLSTLFSETGSLTEPGAPHVC